MPRALRIQDSGFIHHVVCRGNDSQALFSDHDDYTFYLSLLDSARKQFSVSLYNFVLMDNHIHLLVEPQVEGGLSKMMEVVSKGYAKYFNKKHNRMGHVFSGRFKSFLIQREQFFFACSRYIDLTPVKAGMITDASGYVWSGFGSLAYGKKISMKLDMSEIYQDLGVTPHERQIAYRTLVLNMPGTELDLLNRRAGILGDSEFKKKVRASGKKGGS